MLEAGWALGGPGKAGTSVADRVCRSARGALRRIGGVVRHEARHVLLPLALLSAVSWIGTLAAPRLAGRPLLLVALSPRVAFLTLAAHRVALLPFLAVGMLRLCVADPFNFVLGRRHGTAVLARARRFRPLAWFQDTAGRCVPLLVFLRPSGASLALAGATRTRTAAVVVADLVGTAAYLVVVHQVGRTFV